MSSSIVIGAGLGGLTAAIALAQRGLPVTVFEAATRVEASGAGLTLGLGAQHVFRVLDLQERVAAVSCPAGALPFLHYRSGEVLLGALDTGSGLPDDGSANIVRHCYRADLQRVLVKKFREMGGLIHTGKRLVGFEQDSDTITARFADGSCTSGSALVGADGIRSAVRAQLASHDAPRFTHHVAYRFLVPMTKAAPHLSHGRSAIFIGPGRTFNRYTMAGGTILNCAALVESTREVPEGWSTAAPLEELREAFSGWHGDVAGLIENAGGIIKWGLYDRTPLESWSHGRATMLGDAAHAMLPFLGMGAAMAVEDGWVLAQALADEPDVKAAFGRYEAARIPRTTQLHRASKRQGEVTQALNPDVFTLAGAPVTDRTMMEFDPTA